MTDSPIHEAIERVTFADAALGAAGHEITDPVLRALLDRVAREELTVAEAIAKMRRHVQG
ncbi:hypothetical protein EII35_10420 [Arachnia propionica]|uniref:Antitoxin VbhA domain-containing protein n=1 Tax=Arachnia propionica TaxID=1750 RepID=A0A3P1WQY2_9ACTN|nr:hypothetical protein EII35_10420 [Arachnia propionica]